MRIVKSYDVFSRFDAEHDTSPTHVTIDLYRGQNRSVLRMMEYLRSHVARDLCGAYVHGSLATGEEIPYSDFDALVIIKDSVMRVPERMARLAWHLFRAQQILFEFDPLQHHGWFVMTEADLSFHDEAYFPHELFVFSKSMLADQGLELELAPRDSSLVRLASFREVAAAFRRCIRDGSARKDMYRLKSTLSLFLLLPALYVQVRDRRGIFKKFSFDAARQDFSVDEWGCMDRVSEIRSIWRCDMSRVRRRLMSYPGAFRKKIVRLWAPPIPPKIRQLVTEDLLRGMDRLAGRMAENLDAR